MRNFFFCEIANGHKFHVLRGISPITPHDPGAGLRAWSMNWEASIGMTCP